MNGEYWIDSTTLGGDRARHLRFVSTTEALINDGYGAEVPYAIQAIPGAALETVTENGQPAVRGPIVLRSGNETFALAGDPGNGTVEALVARNEISCVQTGITVRSGPATIRLDDDPTVIEGFLPVWIPWETMVIGSKKPAAAPLGSMLKLTSQGANVATSFSAASAGGEVASVHVKLDDGLSLVGQTVTFSGSVISTNGVESPVGPIEVPVLDFGPARSSGLDFTAENPPDLVTLGNPTRASAGSADCPDGCLMLVTGQAVALRLTDPGSTLHVQATGGDLTVQAHARGFDPSVTTKNFVAATELDYPLPAGASEVFVLLTVPYGQPMQTACPVLPVQTTRLVAISVGQ